MTEAGSERRRSWYNMSRLLTLPAPIREKVDAMLSREGERGTTYAEIAKYLEGLGFKTSKTGVWRYTKKLRASGSRQRRMRIVRSDIRTDPAAERFYQLVSGLTELFESVRKEVSVEGRRTDEESKNKQEAIS